MQDVAKAPSEDLCRKFMNRHKMTLTNEVEKKRGQGAAKGKSFNGLSPVFSLAVGVRSIPSFLHLSYSLLKACSTLGCTTRETILHIHTEELYAIRACAIAVLNDQTGAASRADTQTQIERGRKRGQLPFANTVETTKQMRLSTALTLTNICVPLEGSPFRPSLDNLPPSIFLYGAKHVRPAPRRRSSVRRASEIERENKMRERQGG